MSSEQREQQSMSPLCANKCGFYGIPANHNLCSKCYHEFLKRESRNSSCGSSGTSSSMDPLVSSASQLQKVATPVEEAHCSDNTTATPSVTSNYNLNSNAVSGTLSSPPPPHPFPATSIAPDLSSHSNTNALDASNYGTATTEDLHVEATVNQVDRSRCFHCKKRVGLLGLPCRCGKTFCATHLHNDAHKCTFDYKNFERENLRKQNTKIVAEKLRKL